MNDANKVACTRQVDLFYYDTHLNRITWSEVAQPVAMADPSCGSSSRHLTACSDDVLRVFLAIRN
jgi:hypothetical protein